MLQQQLDQREALPDYRIRERRLFLSIDPVGVGARLQQEPGSRASARGGSDHERSLSNSIHELHSGAMFDQYFDEGRPTSLASGQRQRPLPIQTAPIWIRASDEASTKLA